MRIVAGAHRGRRIVAPRGAVTRPTADRVREAVFSIVGPVDGLDVLDLFAGSGALGLEALSRGAASATFVDSGRAALACIRRNVETLGVGDRARVVGRDWRAALAAERAAGRRYGLCLCDPPYSLTDRVVAGIGPALAPVMAASGTVVIEHPAALSPPEPTGLEIATRIDRSYGDTAVAVLRLGRP
ncbi:16S rRNA (guanine(966)-N(2))-methyltransferase RsmD [Miltoncostaea marina]|uniref:16S rRNA (guanine(966)-N(2))-methyltransferase RsmD n=1 Tax=Miltoncostaea marina TaxID=2843215 RepID=UPI001C3CBC44|nr:16S rRNA (guanine(966)-N(2))-methyltransferase RsmD [Miltoncostaea marina]